MTDGEENSSRETTGQQVAEIIKAHEAKGNWTFAYIGENPERWARQTGTQVGNVAQYQHGDPRASFDIARRATSAYRASDAAQSKDFIDRDKKDA